MVSGIGKFNQYSIVNYYCCCCDLFLILLGIIVVLLLFVIFCNGFVIIILLYLYTILYCIGVVCVCSAGLFLFRVQSHSDELPRWPGGDRVPKVCKILLIGE